MKIQHCPSYWRQAGDIEKNVREHTGIQTLKEQVKKETNDLNLFAYNSLDDAKKNINGIHVFSKLQDKYKTMTKILNNIRIEKVYEDGRLIFRRLTSPIMRLKEPDRFYVYIWFFLEDKLKEMGDTFG